MRSPAVDRALRRLVAEIAHVRPDDLHSILDSLDAGQRRTVEGLLERYRGETIAEPAPLPGALAGLSPWLSSRLEAANGAGAGHAMTPIALEALRSAANLPQAKSSAKAAPGRRLP